MGSEQDSLKQKIRRILPGGRERKPEDEGNCVEFQATIGRKGNSVGLTFPSGAQLLGKIKAGMKARIIMVREPGSSIWEARLQFIEVQEEKESVS